jgi:hypothetical protein
VAIGEANTVSGSMINGESAFAGEMMVLGTQKSPTTIRGTSMIRNRLRPIHPGEVLREDSLFHLE